MREIVVVGAGPAGLAAALAALARGEGVTVLEKKSEIGSGISCGELVPFRLLECLPESGGAVVQKVTGLRLVLEGTEWRGRTPSLMVDRLRLQKLLAAEVLRRGGVIYTGAVLSSVSCEGSVSFRWGRKGIALENRLVVACDGPHSRVARFLGLGDFELMLCLQGEAALKRSLEDALVFFAPEFPGGYGWCFPKGELANFGVGIDPMLGSHPEDVLWRALEALLEVLTVEGLISGPGFLKLRRGVVPVSGPRERLVCGRVVFAGDAGGFAHPVTGAGIMGAVVTGAIAGKLAAGGQILNYEEECERALGSYLRRGREGRLFLRRAGGNSKELKYLLSRFWPGMRMG